MTIPRDLRPPSDTPPIVGVEHPILEVPEDRCVRGKSDARPPQEPRWDDDSRERADVPGRDARRGRPRLVVRALAGATFVVIAIVAGGGGYAIGHGTVALPSALIDRLPASASSWLAATRTPRELADYEFELVDSTVKAGPSEVAVRLVHRPTGVPVADAVIFARRLDMAPDGMATMTARMDPRPGSDPGVDRFATKLAMEGTWRLSLAAKIPGRIGTARGELLLKAVP